MNKLPKRLDSLFIDGPGEVVFVPVPTLLSHAFDSHFGLAATLYFGSLLLIFLFVYILRSLNSKKLAIINASAIIIFAIVVSLLFFIKPRFWELAFVATIGVCWVTLAIVEQELHERRT